MTSHMRRLCFVILFSLGTTVGIIKYYHSRGWKTGGRASEVGTNVDPTEFYVGGVHSQTLPVPSTEEWERFSTVSPYLTSESSLADGRKSCSYLEDYVFKDTSANCTYVFEYLSHCVNKTGVGRKPLPNFFLGRENRGDTAVDNYRQANVAFVHMPKAGGTSVEEVLMKIPGLNESGVVNKKRVAHCADLLAHSIRFRQNKKQTLFYSKRTFGLHEYAHQGRPFAYVTWLREPMDRLVSMYHYAKRKGCFVVHEVCVHYLARSKNMTDYLQRSRDVHFQDMDNFYVRLLQFGDFPDVDAAFEDCCRGVQLRDAKHIPKIEEKHYLVARNNLETKMAFVGLTEEFKNSQDMLSYAFGIPTEEKETHVNSNQHEYTLTDFELTELKRRNVWDLKLYEDAKKIFTLQREKYLEIKRATDVSMIKG